MQADLVVVTGFKDHFSARSGSYAKHRPTYPESLFDFLAGVAPGHDCAWDCATGNGQAARAVARYFGRVIATDASESQIAVASPHPNVVFRMAQAEKSGLSDASVDLVTVAQAFHWFDAGRFLDEAGRVLRPSGVLAIWCYELCLVTAKCDTLVRELYRDIVGAFWPPERVYIEQGYRGVELHGQEIEVPGFDMSLRWTVDNMLGYLRTWSACKRFEATHGRDPVEHIEAALRHAWGGSSRTVVWPLSVRASRLNVVD